MNADHLEYTTTRDYRTTNKKSINSESKKPKSTCFRITRGVLGLVINVFRIAKK